MYILHSKNNNLNSDSLIKMRNYTLGLVLLGCFTISDTLLGQTPDILQVAGRKKNYLPDFSYAGYKNGEKSQGAFKTATILDPSEYGAFPDDGLDDSRALVKMMEEAEGVVGDVVIQFAKGQYILSEILYISRGNIVLRGTGSGASGTIIYCPRPMKYIKDPESLQELREYLVKFDKQQREEQNNIDLPFSQYAWSGGMIWVRRKGTRVKSYLPEYRRGRNKLAQITHGKRGSRTCTVESAAFLKVGDVVQIDWYNKSGEDGSLIEEVYGNHDIKIGSHHWRFPDEPLVKQQVRIVALKGNEVTLSSPLLLDAEPEWHTSIYSWEHLENVGIESLSMLFPMAETIAHHVEEGFNGIYLTRLYDGWVKDIRIMNSDAGILTEEVANVTISDIETIGDKLAHYSVYVGGVHNVLVNRLSVKNKVRHPLSFNTFSTKSVFKNCEVFIDPILDQHSGANHQNLFDNVKVHISLGGADSYPLFAGGGAGYWKPSHGAYNTFWNIEVHFLDGLGQDRNILLDGMKDGPSARIIGVHANMPLTIKYGPNAYLEWSNQKITRAPSLYDYQMNQRIGQ